MIEWVEAGKRILQQSENLDPVEKAVLSAQLKASEQVVFALQRALAVVKVDREPKLVCRLFAERYPEYAGQGYTADLQATLAIDSPFEVRRLEEAALMIKDAVEGYLGVLKDEGQEIPQEKSEVVIPKEAQKLLKIC